ncbi:DUF1995 family protein [Planktothrix sp. FACHB-1355]|uniref:DUF1995 family protein n=1 Tax=Aerosakkonema funiforme FACHB-1375 TaxID=2949571 RepID=A0A926VEN7_9CYAN|nr:MULTISPECIES: DUF1995 family protein [Oscillatoriales]MBD2181818.1 DUF1995 family protein [Aerosakkonema funiforme FACHB-1375]MBD3559653.1 DUF1995 family protein [Planktothrix sp. FACHB-1355]
MAELPNTLEEAIAQSRQATLAAIADGYTRLQVELLFPEIALQAQSIAKQFIEVFEDRIGQVKMFFPDAGAAALARRDWGEVPFKIQDIGMGRTPIENKIQPEDEIFLLVNLSSVEVAEVEKLCNAVGDRPVILLIPHLEDAGTVGIGYAGRQLRERFLNTLQSCYYVRPLQGAAVFRCYPGPWQVWLEVGDNYNLIAELPQKPVGEEVDRIIFDAIGPTDSDTAETPRPKKPGFFTNMQRFLRALNR